jgi:hypothetical protein
MALCVKEKLSDLTCFYAFGTTGRKRELICANLTGIPEGYQVFGGNGSALLHASLR